MVSQKNLRERYFKLLDNEWQIQDEIRKNIDFRQLNLVHSWSDLPNIDIILLRNVLIYFDINTKKKFTHQS
ncbi:CheR family methyltransferase [Nostoc piscinale]|uniref:CheR family methyltransferase n=1 Tax=Nostoc piscinale TaxID=224012 RepID=UPI000A56DD36|nr:CheR family methyltransferase [Nostoc piscinale]